MIKGIDLKLDYYVNRMGICNHLKDSVSKIIAILYDIEVLAEREPSYTSKYDIIHKIDGLYQEVNICMTTRDIYTIVKSLLIAKNDYVDLIHRLHAVRRRVLFRYTNLHDRTRTSSCSI
jgi:hypothetical protein